MNVYFHRRRGNNSGITMRNVRKYVGKSMVAVPAVWWVNSEWKKVYWVGEGKLMNKRSTSFYVEKGFLVEIYHPIFTITSDWEGERGKNWRIQNHQFTSLFCKHVCIYTSSFKVLSGNLWQTGPLHLVDRNRNSCKPVESVLYEENWDWNDFKFHMVFKRYHTCVYIYNSVMNILERLENRGRILWSASSSNGDSQKAFPLFIIHTKHQKNWIPWSTIDLRVSYVSD